MQLNEGMKFHNRYLLKTQLGSGGFSEVWLVEDARVGDKKVALKVYAPGTGLDEDGVELFSREYQMVFDLNHSHLLRPSHFDVYERSPYLVLPFCERGSASKLVGKITEEEAWRFLRDVASGLLYLHGQKTPVIHQDIKPDNVLIDHEGRYLLTDFGISAKARSTLRKSMGSATSGGTVAYMSPERFGKDPAPIMASDVWSLGAVMYELLAGDVPFGEHGGLVQKSGAETPNIHGEYSENLKNVVYRMLSMEPWDRPTAEQLVELANKRGAGQASPHERPRPEDRSRPTTPLREDRPTPPRLDTEPSPPPPHSPSVLKVILSVTLSAIVIAALAYYIGRDSGPVEIPAIDMVQVSGGTFTMGCTPEQGGDCASGERWTHQVTLSDYEIGKYEVTQAQWQAVMGNNPSNFKGDNLPVENVSWNKVQEFIKKLNAATGRNYRLPTEAEWEYAARGGSRSRGYKYSGSGNIGDVAWYGGNSGSKTHPVGTKQANELGIHDMSGNVYEWVSDWYGGYSGNTQTNPGGASSGSYRVDRGGGWLDGAQSARVSARYYDVPGPRSGYLGFRLARSSK